ncbi:MAG: sugar-binding protein [Armatimonadota bacterium]|nr:sugar-binding protein [Armatimonadota bacterium]
MIRAQCVSHTAALLAAMVLAAPAGAEWAVEEADARLPLSLEGDLHARQETRLEVVIDFNELLGASRMLAADSLTLIDARSGETVPLELAQDAVIRYASGNPILRLRWPSGAIAPFEERTWYLYFRTVAPGAEDAWRPLEQTFVPRDESLLLETSFEEANAEHPQWPERWWAGGRDKPGETTERVWTDEQARTGELALKIARTFEGEPPHNTNRPFWWTWPPSMPVREGQGVRASAWVKATELDGRAFASIMLEFRDAENGRLHEGMLRLRGERQPHDWIRVTGSTTAPKDAASAVLWFSLAGGAGEVFCDDATVIAIPGGELPALVVEAGELEERAAFAARREETPEGKVLTCGEARQPPVLDGALDDACWEEAGRVSDLEVFFAVPGTDVSTTVLACADREALYFGFICTEPSTENLVAEVRERDGPVWTDDSVELFLDTNRDRRTYYQIIVNPTGVFFDQDAGAPELDGPGWNGPVEVATTVLPDCWQAEVKLEFAGLRLAEAEGRAWGANFARTSKRGGRSTYTWVDVESGFGDPQHFGRLVLPFDPTANSVTGRPLAAERVFWGQGALDFAIDNRRREAVEARLVISEETPQGLERLAETPATVAPRSTREMEVLVSFEETGEVRLRYELLGADGTVLSTTSVTHTVPPPLQVAPDSLVSYLGETTLTGDFSLGVAESALPEAKLELSVLGRGDDEPALTATISPEATVGPFEVEVADLPEGAYQMRVALRLGGEIVGEETFAFHRVASPFSATGLLGLPTD